MRGKSLKVDQVPENVQKFSRSQKLVLEFTGGGIKRKNWDDEEFHPNENVRIKIVPTQSEPRQRGSEGRRHKGKENHGVTGGTQGKRLM